MEILFLSFLCALSYIIILCKIFSLTFIARTQLFWDVLFTLGVPFLFIGTFSGMSTAIITGVIFSMITFFLSILVGKQKPIVPSLLFLYGKRRKKNNNCCAHPPRS